MEGIYAHEQVLASIIELCGARKACLTGKIERWDTKGCLDPSQRVAMEGIYAHAQVLSSIIELCGARKACLKKGVHRFARRAGNACLATPSRCYLRLSHARSSASASERVVGTLTSVAAHVSRHRYWCGHVSRWCDWRHH